MLYRDEIALWIKLVIAKFYCDTYKLNYFFIILVAKCDTKMSSKVWNSTW
ncbi:hypothetical protein H1P_1300014 [Hyella patelloides LEGE 07179]|uniref:Uncharacterized protein n=1 Tax=Hyella patelloides LEGE 07179 TaxID=945734 RepID=A0A563VKS8_9CYAN|nr:hypothetical protein H1P_1300014 [Hyella patelloides LEGE 07179]